MNFSIELLIFHFPNIFLILHTIAYLIKTDIRLVKYWKRPIIRIPVKMIRCRAINITCNNYSQGEIQYSYNTYYKRYNLLNSLYGIYHIATFSEQYIYGYSQHSSNLNHINYKSCFINNNIPFVL